MNRNIVRRRRVAYGLTQAELAELATVSPTTIFRYEQGATDITDVVERAIIGAMNDWWNGLSPDERHRAKLHEWALQLNEESEDRHVTTLSYMTREIGMYLTDLTKL